MERPPALCGRSSDGISRERTLHRPLTAAIFCRSMMSSSSSGCGRAWQGIFRTSEPKIQRTPATKLVTSRSSRVMHSSSARSSLVAGAHRRIVHIHGVR